MHVAFKALRELGVIVAGRPVDVGGQALPFTVQTISTAYLMAGNLSAFGVAGLTSGAAHLIEAFGSDALKAQYLSKMYAGEWTGTMALTEPQAGSSLADVTSRAQPTSDGHYLIKGSKIFISGGDHDLVDNIVHLVLARIDGAPPGTKGISLFAVPKKRVDAGGKLVANDVHVSGVIHKIGWRGLPSLALGFGDEGDCRGWLVGTAHQGLKHMFQMMNEARIMVGTNATATASVAFHESLAYARDRVQGRPLGAADASTRPVPIIEHADVRRMLLRQKAIVEGSLALVTLTARYADWAQHAAQEDVRARSKLLLDLLTPMAKTFPSEKGFESNALALQIHGGYGYSSEYLPEAWLRDQKLNTLHEGTTTIQGLDLLGRKVVAHGGAALMALGEEVSAELATAAERGDPTVEPLQQALEEIMALAGRLAQGELLKMMGHSADFMELMSITVIGWVWLKLTNALGKRTDDFAQGLRSACRYWLATEVRRVPALARLCAEAEPSYLEMKDAWF